MTANPFAALLDGVQRYGYVYNKENCEWELTTLRDDGQYVCLSEVLAALAAKVPADLAEAGKVLEGVSEGPWAVDGEDQGAAWGVAWSVHAAENILDVKCEGVDTEANARFIAWARNNVPALIALATAQAAQLEALEKERDAAAAKTKKNAKIAAKAYTIITLAADDLQDEGDRVYFGSTNTADILRDAREEWIAHRITGEDVLPLVEENRVLKARGEAAETALAASEARVAKLVEAWDLVRSHSRVKVTLGDGDARKSWGAFLIAVDEARAAITEAGHDR